MATLAARLELLYQLGTTTIPHLGDQFASAGTQLHAIPSTGWARDLGLGTGATGSYDAWFALVDTISSYCRQTDNHLKDTGKALIAAANDYAHTDGAAEAEYKKLTGQV